MLDRRFKFACLLLHYCHNCYFVMILLESLVLNIINIQKRTKILFTYVVALDVNGCMLGLSLKTKRLVRLYLANLYCFYFIIMKYEMKNLFPWHRV